jgi:N-methylhydantoinase B
MKNDIDLITFEVIKNALGTIADEMALVVMRTAYSHILRDAMDYSTAVCDTQGRFIAQGLTNPIHLGSFPDAMRRLVDEYGERTQPGDIFIFNDPYGSGGMHLPDFFVIKPVFVDDTLVGYAAALGHQCDVGGIAPGGMALYATEIYQEGLRIPLMKLSDAGKPNETLLQIIEKNVRVPVQVLGDIRALQAACMNGERGLQQLVSRYGIDNFARYVEALHDHAERLMRAEIAALTDGVYEFEDWLDGMGDDPTPIRFKVTITINGDAIKIDWAGTSKQVKAAINGPLPTTNSMAYLAVRCAVRAPIPNCQGFTRPIEVTAPLGSVVNPREPAACAARGIIAYRMMDTMFGALAKVTPERIPAACEGGPSSPQFAGDHEGKRWVTGGGLLGCWGGRYHRDGLDGVSNPGANMSNQPIELIEAGIPIEITRYGFAEHSGGPGRSRGGYALLREYRMIADETSLHMRSDRRAILPYGLDGGLPGTPSWNIINPGGEQRTLPVCPMKSVPLRRGDSFCHVQPGGGGHGDPLERDPEKVLDAVDNEMISEAYANDVYGVVVRDRAVDEDATVACRAALRAGPRDETIYLRYFHESIGIDPDVKVGS